MPTETQRRENFAKLAAQIDAAGGAMVVPEMRLRDAYGVKKFGVHVAESIEVDYLRRAGIDILRPWGDRTLPGKRLQRDQRETVTLFTVNSQVGKVISYVRDPTNANVRKLNEAVASEAAETLEAVRAILAKR